MLNIRRCVVQLLCDVGVERDVVVPVAAFFPSEFRRLPAIVAIISRRLYVTM